MSQRLHSLFWSALSILWGVLAFIMSRKLRKRAKERHRKWLLTDSNPGICNSLTAYEPPAQPPRHLALISSLLRVTSCSSGPKFNQTVDRCKIWSLLEKNAWKNKLCWCQKGSVLHGCYYKIFFFFLKMVMSFLLSFKELKGFAQTVLCSRSNKCCTNVYIAVDHYYALLEKGKAT